MGASLPRIVSLAMEKTLMVLFHVLDAKCPACRKRDPKPFLCVECSKLEAIGQAICQICGRPNGVAVDTCGQCFLCPVLPLSAVRSSFVLNDNMKNLMHTIKYSKRFERLYLFRSRIPRQLPFSDLKDFVIVPVPISLDRFLQRTFNQSEWLAKELARGTGATIITNGLKKIRETPPQSSLGRTARKSNLVRAFKWKKKKVPKRVLLVDDIYTTGETLRQCARALTNAGVDEVFAWTLFRVV